ncbi:hypothetical protein MZK49_06890 [Ensifer sesbaniae]|uniref:hypothetical protein n=1 Tax=Ensifer sesbaniae TaxID=1214071 RepID=UPI002000997E|nr:hypothetical protein [Ensifer sesbaniae]
MSALPEPSEQLDAIVRSLSPHCGAAEVTLPGESFDNLVRQLATLRKLMVNMEREVGAFRLAEAAREGRKAVDQLASDQLHRMVADPEGKVIRPDFGGRN